MPAVEDEQDGEEQTEEERVHRRLLDQIDSTVNESLDSTRRMLQLTEESKEAGIKTLVFLDEQGEQLERIEEGMGRIQSDMKDAEKSLEGLEKCCGLCVLPWKKTKNRKAINFDVGWKDPSDQTNTEGPRPMVGGGMAPTGNMVARITNDAREDEMEGNLQQVGGMLHNLKNMAIDMGNEINSQNRTAEEISQVAQSNQTRVKDANKRTKQLLKS